MTKTLLPIILIFCSSLLNAQSNDIKTKLMKELQSMSSKNRTIASKFEQTKMVVGIKKLIISNGNFYYDNTGNMALIYDKPQGDKILMKGSNFTVISNGKTIKMDSSNPVMAQVSYMMKAAMSGDITCFGQGWEMVIAETDNTYIINLKPQQRKIKQYVKYMEMKFNKKDMTLDNLAIYSPDDAYTKYNFFSKTINIEINKHVFE